MPMAHESHNVSLSYIPNSKSPKFTVGGEGDEGKSWKKKIPVQKADTGLGPKMGEL